MKKPEEIKKGLECCATLEPINEPCGECSYAEINFGVCSNFVCADALAYIQQLEEHITFLREILQEEVYRKDAAIADINMVCPCEVCTRSCKYDKVNAYSECADFEWRGVQNEPPKEV